MSITPDTLSAYQKALYWVRTTPNILLRVASVSYEAQQLLEHYDADSAAIITSDNPKSELRSQAENSFYRDQLQHDVIQTQCPFFLTVSVDPTGKWPDEHGFLILDLPTEDTAHFMRKFNQWACVWIEKDGTVSLLTQRVESDPGCD